MNEAENASAQVLPDRPDGDNADVARDGVREPDAKAVAGVPEAAETSGVVCPAEARARQARFGSHHTYRCGKEDGHEGAHEFTDGVRTVTWYGEARKQEDDTRYRFGFTP